jgi:hypothetical protein
VGLAETKETMAVLVAAGEQAAIEQDQQRWA